MLLIRGQAGGTALTGTLYEPGDQPPTYSGSPDPDTSYVWVCDAFYEVESGGQPQQIDDRMIRVAFESPAPRGFDSYTAAVGAAEEHLRTQFVRIGVDSDRVEIDHLEPKQASA